MPPYAVLDRLYSRGLVKMMLAAGNVTSANPWMRPAVYTALISRASGQLVLPGVTLPICYDI